MAKSDSPPWTHNLSKGELHDLIARVKSSDSAAIEKSITFITADSLGIWHNRARAKLCRYFKSVPPNQEQKKRLVAAIKKRLIEGDFYEQFKDQLGMATNFDSTEMLEAAEIAAQSEKRYIRKYAQWVLNRIANSSTPNTDGLNR